MRKGYVGEFRTSDELLQAAAELRRRGYRELDAFTPYPIRGLEQALGLPRSRIARMIFPVAIAGAGLGYLIQLWCNAFDYPLNVGGRPLDSTPAFIPITFEAGVLTAGLSGLFILTLLCRLPDLYSPLVDVPGFERASIDTFWVGIDERDPSFNEVQIERDLRDLGAVTVARTRERAR
ncbi:ABC-type Fe3+ transport system protein [Minicystis rosea]|nr:ABC-type Fe3+ transport system protein [Minicystis rosea]